MEHIKRKGLVIALLAISPFNTVPLDKVRFVHKSHGWSLARLLHG
jgi:hypothetical protein